MPTGALTMTVAFGVEGRAGHAAGDGVRAGLRDRRVVGGRRPDHAHVRPGCLPIRGRHGRRQPRHHADGRVHGDVGDVREPRRERRFARDVGGRDLGRRRAAAAGGLRARPARSANRGDGLVAERDAIEADVAQPRVKRRLAVLLRASEEQAVGRRRLRQDLRGRHVDVGRLPRLRAVDVRREHAAAGSSTTAKCSHWFSTIALAAVSPRTGTIDDRGRAESLCARRQRRAGSPRLAEVEHGS